MEAPFIVVDRLVKTYPKRTSRRNPFRREIAPRINVLDGVSFTVQRGEILGVLGTNGAGKTTLLHTLGALSYWDSGTITIDGLSARTDPMAVRRLVGLSTVQGEFYGRLSVRENLRFFGSLCGVKRHNLESRITEVLALVALEGRDSSPYRTLSTGLRQRVNVARALLGDPPLLMLDEPTRAVDPINTDLLRRLIRQTLVNELGKTVILATNILDEAWELCDRVAVLRAGKIQALESPHELQQSAAGARRYRIVVDELSDDLLARIRNVPGLISLTTASVGDERRIDVYIEPLDMSLTALLRTVSSNGVKIRDVSSQGASPAAVFAALVNRA